MDSYSQNFTKNSIYYDAFGHTRSPFSLNYERSICKIYKGFHLNGRIGIGFYKYYDTQKDIVTDIATIFPAVALLEYGKKNHFVNIGFGYSNSFIKKIRNSEVPRFDVAYSISVGYKFINDYGLFVQIYPSVIYPKISQKELGAGISLGFSW